MTHMFSRALGASAIALSVVLGGLSGAVVTTAPASAQAAAFVPFVILINGVPVTVTSLEQLASIVAANPGLAATIASAANAANPTLTTQIARTITSVPGVNVASVQSALTVPGTQTAGLPTGGVPTY